jgi:hypothetical protein
MKTQMKIKNFTMLAILVVLLSCSGFSQENKTPTITKIFDLNQPGSLYARSSGGGIEVSISDQHKVTIEAFIRKNGILLAPHDPMVKEILEDFKVDFEQNGSEIVATVERRINFNVWKNVGISLNIIVPREMSCDVSSSGGGIKISGVEGSHTFSSSGGGVELQNISGSTRASSSGGRVYASDLIGEIHLSSSGGGVTVNDARGNVFAHSSGGGVTLTNIYGDVDANSSGGGVKVSGEVGFVKATSSGGSVKVNLNNLKKELYLQSSGGGIDAIIHNGENLGLNLDLSSDHVNINLHNFSGRAEKNRVKGTMNKGGIPVYMHASGGSVNVRFED